MGMPAQQIQQLATVTSAPESFTLVVLILGALFTLILGGYVFTWKSTTSIWRAIAKLCENELHDIKKRLEELEK